MGTTGMRFQQGRMDAGFTLSEVAVALDIDARYLFALEEESYDDLPGKTFAIGYAKTYASYLGLNPKKIAEEIMKEIGYDESSFINSSLEKRLFKPEDHIEKRNKQWEDVSQRSARHRRLLVSILITLAVLALFSFFGSRLWV
ncbi:MAG TPA: helix-turn-helix domain-containing protein [Clostridiales bacterium]|nr:helix-turn-helix domain-containing protein [Clostridiales bacterium]